MSRRPETPGARLRRVLVPGTTGGVYSLIPGAIGFFTVLTVFVIGFFTGREVPGVATEILFASVGMLGVHTWRARAADRANADSGLGPVPVDPSDPAQASPSTAPGRLPDPRPIGE